MRAGLGLEVPADLRGAPEGFDFGGIFAVGMESIIVD